MTESDPISDQIILILILILLLIITTIVVMGAIVLLLPIAIKAILLLVCSH